MIEYYTVKQFAELYDKDPGNIRRMLINGTLTGEKVGRQWLIPKDIEYPDDRRVKSGEYKYWRQRRRFSNKHPEIYRKLCRMCEHFVDIYGSAIEEVVLYGSYARCQESIESDVDMAIVLKGNQSDEQSDRMVDIVVDYQLDLGITLSVITIELQEFLDWKRSLPFYRNIEKDGIVLWKSA